MNELNKYNVFFDRKSSEYKSVIYELCITQDLYKVMINTKIDEDTLQKVLELPFFKTDYDTCLKEVKENGVNTFSGKLNLYSTSILDTLYIIAENKDNEYEVKQQLDAARLLLETLNNLNKNKKEEIKLNNEKQVIINLNEKVKKVKDIKVIENDNK